MSYFVDILICVGLCFKIFCKNKVNLIVWFDVFFKWVWDSKILVVN